MTNKKFIRLIETVTVYGYKVLVEGNYSDQQLKELISVLRALLEEACWK